MTDTITLTDQWQALDTEPIPGGTVGGDGAGEAMSVRWGKKNADGTYAFITTYFYDVDGAMRDYGDTTDDDGEPLPARFSVENMTEFRITEDVDAEDEVWCDYQYDDECGVMTWLTEDEAVAKARQLTARELAPGWFDSAYNWDGAPF